MAGDASLQSIQLLPPDLIGDIKQLSYFWFRVRRDRFELTLAILFPQVEGISIACLQFWTTTMQPKTIIEYEQEQVLALSCRRVQYSPHCRREAKR